MKLHTLNVNDFFLICLKYDGMFVLNFEIKSLFNFQVGECHFGSIASSFQVYLSSFDHGNEILKLGKHPFVASSPNAVCF